MKECLSCHNQVEDLRPACPHCGGTMFVASGQDALSRAETMQKQIEAREHNDRGGQLMMQRRYTEAESEFRMAVAANLYNATAHGNVGLALYEQGRLGEAISWLEKALTLNSNLEGAAEALVRWKAEANKAQVSQSLPTSLKSSKNPLVAGVLNVLIVGLGHIYLDNWIRGIATFLIVPIGFAVLASIVGGMLAATDGHRACVPILALVFLGALFWDGYQAAARYNQK